jgi:hypothetical protein
MKVLIPLSTVLRIVFWLVTIAVVAALAAGQRTSATPLPQPPDSSATAQVVRADQGEEVTPSCRRT